ncbi:MAG: Gfo/Idh/MocA family oxidoreductase [Verrucomicrobiae bacterium]|nr:Gfo/Idh/MocA family oxidoreductase [Verrucomicrobiae bacterium]
MSRREFCQTAVVASAAFALPMILPRRLFGADAPSNRIRIGQIGCGRIAQGHDMPGVLGSGLADIVAVCDVDSKRAMDARRLVEEHYLKKGAAPPDVVIYRDYRELLERKDIDAVVVSTPDHWHAEQAAAAALAGKDIYLQKPMALTVAESRLLLDVITRTKRIVQIGSQQRSMDQFRRACELVRAGRVGQLKRIEIGLPVDPTKPDDPEQPVPPNLDYDRWLGCTPKVYYTEQRVHPQKDYSRPGWLRCENYCLGMITGWGTHHLDTAHWALGIESGGPLKVEGRAEFPPPEHTIWNVHGPYDVELVYPGGVRMLVSNKFPNGVKFIGDEGWIFVAREGQTTSSDPASPSTSLKPLDASDPKLLDPRGLTVELYRSNDHHKNWLECVRTRKTPVAPATAGHAALCACFISWVAMKLGRPLAWDAKAERFVDDNNANAMLSRPERAPYGVHRLMEARG